MFVQAGGVLVKGQEVWMNVWVDLHDVSSMEVVMAKLHRRLSLSKGFTSKRRNQLFEKSYTIQPYDLFNAQNIR